MPTEDASKAARGVRGLTRLDPKKIEIGMRARGVLGPHRGVCAGLKRIGRLFLKRSLIQIEG